ncbi:glycoside hydrolase family 6 protein [Shewanella violacea]|uniref:Glucanase n=1 Tax=Shewanella violacea (strain JCM 10179 / CIP 106290 / LMG 19151 / DSS12) TaxID=637905 RepID=D4ZGP8_SHEVD|nr:glycoside hydrolase family 6 protein [Shewanella violacea]BAJ00847.1 1,4-beta-cellobiosidase, putative [Shewanella violacea DSS12]
MRSGLIKGVTLTSMLLATLQANAAVKCDYSIENEWETGFVGAIQLKNTGETLIDGWQVSWQYLDGSTVSSAWNSTFSGNSPYLASNLVWNNLIQPGETITFGIQGEKGIPNKAASTPKISGEICTREANNSAPMTSFTIIESGLDISFDASATRDADGDELTYSWDFGDETLGEGVNTEHSFSSLGSYIVTLTVSDGLVIDEHSIELNIKSLVPNQAPLASFNTIHDGLALSFNASNSSDPEGDALSYLWSFGDGTSQSGINTYHQYAAHGLYTVTLNVSDGSSNTQIRTELLVTYDGATGQHVANPFLGTTSYINPDYAKFVDASMALESAPHLQAKMAQVKQQATAVWLDRIDAIYGGEINSGRLSLEQHFDNALAQKRVGVPITVSIVVYNLPDRDCAALASNGTLNAAEGGLEIYKHDYIDTIANIAAAPRFEDLRIIAVIEPDSLPNLVTNTRVLKCGIVNSNGTYVEGVQYALSRFSRLDNVYSYLDIAHSGWLGWDTNMRGAIDLYTSVVAGVADGDMSVLDGFISNVANYTPAEEIFLPDPEFDFDGDFMGIKSSSYYEWNPVFDEKDFAQSLHAEFVAKGFPTSLAMLIDTSRNGWGASDRPTSPNEDASNEDQYVMDSKLDRRAHRGNWCNSSGAGIGARPETLPFGSTSVIQAYVWIKPPGESDGTSDASQTTPDEEGKSFDPMCSPEFTTSGGVLTGAMNGAPSAGAWFHEQFKMLVENAHPEL